jgi:uncharacterized LabA/DUF88 family protein
MARVAVFVDGANFFYMQKNDLGWFVDAKKLLEYCGRFGEVVDAYYYIGKDAPPVPEQQSYLNALTYIGYALVTKPIKTIRDPLTGETRQKANLDIEIVLDMFNTLDNYDIAILSAATGISTARSSCCAPAASASRSSPRRASPPRSCGTWQACT